VRRREFIAGLVSAAASPAAAQSQQQATPVIAFISATPPDRLGEQISAFEKGLAQLGYVRGKNVVIAYDTANDQSERFPALVADAVRRRVSAIVVPDTPGARAAKPGTSSIPVIFLVGQDPVEVGLVSSLSGSGTNMTGVSILNTGMIGKRLQLMRELLPQITTVAALADPTNTGIIEAYEKEVGPAEKNLGVHLSILTASRPSEIDTAFGSLAGRRVEALLLTGHLLYMAQRDRIVALASHHRVPVLYPYRSYVDAGGLISYGSSISEPWQILGNYAGRVLKGERPADLPIQQITKIELAINLTSARALGLNIPETLLATADEVVQ
jgi:putative ABC transport system substrate-binding protein